MCVAGLHFHLGQTAIHLGFHVVCTEEEEVRLCTCSPAALPLGDHPRPQAGREAQ